MPLPEFYSIYENPDIDNHSDTWGCKESRVYKENTIAISSVTIFSGFSVLDEEWL